MRMARKLVTSLVLFTPLALAADASLADLIMPDARVVLGIDIARLRSSPLLPSFSDGVRSANPEMQKLMQAAGFDPLRDLEQILFASPGTGKNPPALLIARGNFDAARLRSFAEAAGSKILDWKGVPILTDPEKESGAFALLDNMILAGNLDQIKAAIGRRGQGMVLNTEMAMRIADLGRRYDAWLVSIAPVATMADNLPSDAKIDGINNLEMLRSIDQFSLGLSLNSDFTLAAELVAKNGKAAGKLADAIQMLLAMANESAKDQPAAMAALHNLKFGVDNNVVHFGVTVPMADVQKAVQEALNGQKGKPVLTALRRTRAQEQPTVTGSGPILTEPAASAPEAPSPEVSTEAGPTVTQEAAAAPPAPEPPAAAPAPVRVVSAAKSPKIPTNGQILVQSSPKDMGTVVIIGQKP